MDAPSVSTLFRCLLAAGAMLALAGCQTGMGSLVTGEDGGTSLFAELGLADKARGKAYFRSNDFGLAEKSFTAALKKAPDDVEAWLGLAASYDRLGRFDLADKAYGRALQAGGRRPELLNNMGYSYLLRGDKAKARSILREAAAGAPGNTVIQANLRMLDAG